MLAHMIRRAERIRLLRMFTMLIPPFGRFQMAQLQVDRRLDAIQCIEAIRIYAAAHGKFPSGLNEISEAPAPARPGHGTAV